MNTTTIFVTYNPNSILEETLAVRLHSIGVSGGLRMFLPDRYNSQTVIEEETKIRISKSQYFVMFSTTPLSNIVKQEIEYASQYIHDISRVIVIYDREKGKNLKGDITNFFTPFYLDRYNNSQGELLAAIMRTIEHKEQVVKIQQQQKQIEKLKKEKEEYEWCCCFIRCWFRIIGLGKHS